jgi:hypothetical protein
MQSDKRPVRRKGLIAILRGKIAARPKAAQGIVAEIPQEAHRRFRGIEAESPVFSASARKKCAQTGNCRFLMRADDTLKQL